MTEYRMLEYLFNQLTLEFVFGLGEQRKSAKGNVLEHVCWGADNVRYVDRRKDIWVRLLRLLMEEGDPQG